MSGFQLPLPQTETLLIKINLSATTSMACPSSLVIQSTKLGINLSTAGYGSKTIQTKNYQDKTSPDIY